MMVAYLIDISKYVFSGLFLLLAGWSLVNMHLKRASQDHLLDLRKISANTTLPLRLQAYERAILLLERINPTNMLLRLYTSDMTALEMQQLILSEIRAEFQHNVTQQLYISNHAWLVIKKVMNDTVMMVNSTIHTLPENASALLLNKTILNHLEHLEVDNPYDIALTVIKRDIQQLF